MKNPTPYLKMRVIGAIEFAPGKTLAERFQEVAKMSFVDEEGQPHFFTWRTIETWFSRYRKWGITAMHNKARSDKGKTRKVSAEQLQEAIEQVRGVFRETHPKKLHIYRACIERGLIRPETVSKTSFYRLVNGLELLKPESENKRRLAFSKQYANQMWQADTMFGPYVPDGSGDNAQAKGKVERFFRTVRDQFLSRNLDLSSLDALNKAFTLWVEDDYNSRTHSTLQMKPIDRFGLDLKRIRFLAISEATDEIFFVEEDRSVRPDNTFPLKNIRFETPADLANRKIKVRFDRKNFDPNKVIVYYKDQRIGPARPVDFVANDRPSRQPPAGETRSDNPSTNN